MLDFISFGSGSSGNCYYLFTETDGLLIDIGVGIRSLRKSFHDYGLDFFSGFKNILITHDHADHIKSVGSLSKKLDIPVWTTAAVHGGIDKSYSVKCKLMKHNRKIIEKNVPFNVGEFHVTPFAVPHDSTDNVGYEISCQGVVFTILTDVGHVTEEIKALIRRTNYLVVEANYDSHMLANGPYPAHLQERIRCGTGHLSNTQCAQLLTENYTENLRHVWLCHLSHENNKPEIAHACVVDTMKSAGIEVGVKVDVEPLRRKLPPGVFHLV